MVVHGLDQDFEKSLQATNMKINEKELCDNYNQIKRSFASFSH